MKLERVGDTITILFETEDDCHNISRYFGDAYMCTDKVRIPGEKIEALISGIEKDMRIARETEAMLGAGI